MAERRMFSRTVVEMDAFMDMPLSAQALYFHLGLFADDDGFVNNPTTVQRMIGASKDDLRILISKGFLIVFESGVVVITHWSMSNAVRKDRYRSTVYQKEMAMLTQGSNGMYLLKSDNQLTTNWQPSDNQLTTNGCHRLGKDRSVEDRLVEDRLVEDRNTPSSERSKIAAEPEADVEAIILKDGTEWRPSQSDFDEYSRLFPTVDVTGEFRMMRSWCNNNPTRRKTKSGVKRFVNGWLSRAQDKGRHANGNSADEILREMIRNDETGNG